MNETANGTVTYTDGGGRDVVSYYATITGTSWKLVVTAPTSEVYDAVNKAQMFAFLSVAVFLVLVIIISVLLAKFIVKPVLSISDTMKKVAEGDLTERVKIGSQDEIGDMSRNINAMIESLAGIVQKINLAINQVSAASEELLDSAEQSSKAAAHIASSIQEVASGADTQLQGAEQSATAMEEMATRTGTGKSNRPSDR